MCEYCGRAFISRNKLFIKFPGRDIGGFWAFFSPFHQELWLALLGFTLTVPAFFVLCYKTLKYYNLHENVSFGYGQNIFVLFNAFSQQVQVRQCQGVNNTLSNLHYRCLYCLKVEANNNLLISLREQNLSQTLTPHVLFS